MADEKKSGSWLLFTSRCHLIRGSCHMTSKSLLELVLLQNAKLLKMIRPTILGGSPPRIATYMDYVGFCSEWSNLGGCTSVIRSLRKHFQTGRRQDLKRLSKTYNSLRSSKNIHSYRWLYHYWLYKHQFVANMHSWNTLKTVTTRFFCLLCLHSTPFADLFNLNWTWAAF